MNELSELLLESILKSLRTYQAQEGKHSFHYFDKPTNRKPKSDEDEREEDFEPSACAVDCCDDDCECDDCQRCASSNLETNEEDNDKLHVSAAAA